MVIGITSILEAVLHDFHERVQLNIHEGVVNLDHQTVEEIRTKSASAFDTYISLAKKHGFFGEAEDGLYDDLEKLRKARNRVHIQNLKNNKPYDESRLFTPHLKFIAELCLERVFFTMHNKYPRPNHVHNQVQPFIVPWEPNLDTSYRLFSEESED